MTSLLKKQEHYNYFMSRRVLSIITAFTLSALFTLSPVTSSYAVGDARPKLAGSPFDLVNAVNALRAAYGLAPYSINPILMYTAQSQADFLAATGTMTHTGFGGSGLTDRLLTAGYPLGGELSAGGFRAENITGGNENMPAQSAVDQWTGDALHLSTMLSPDLTEIGAGVSVSNGRVYYVIDCARPIDSVASDPSTLVAGSGSTAPASEVPIAVPLLSTPNSSGDVIHEVQIGQTLWQLAIAYNVKIDQIRSLNNLVDNSIYPGTKLLIKTGVVQPTATHTETQATALTEISTAMSTLTSTPVANPLPPSPSANPNTIMGVIMAIIVLALLGGLFTWLGSSKR
jgi:uncharacterized protein YkwD/LysM repeat protein